MKKYLLLLFVLLATAGTAVADCYFYIDQYEFNGYDLGTQISIPVHAHFDARLDTWLAKITLPEGLTPIRKKALPGADMAISYEDENGETAVWDRTFTVSEQDGTLNVLCFEPNMPQGYCYEDFGDESYGSVKWEYGDYYDMFTLQLRVEEYFAGGEVVIETIVSSAPDTRGGTVADNGDASNPYTYYGEISFYDPLISAPPIIIFEEDVDGVLVVVEGEGELFGEVQVNGDTFLAVSGNGRFECFVQQNEIIQEIYVSANAIQPGCLESEWVEAYYELAPMPNAPVPLIDFYMDDDYAYLVISGDGNLTLYIDDEVVASGEAQLNYRIERLDEDRVVLVEVRADIPGYIPSTMTSEYTVPARYIPIPTEIPCYTTEVTDNTVVVTVCAQAYLTLNIDGVVVAEGYGDLTYALVRSYEDMVYSAIVVADAGSGYLPTEIEFDIFVPALAHIYDFVENGIYYKITSEGKVSVCYESTNYNSYSGNVVIPATVTHEGMTYKVTGIYDRAFKDCTDLTGVTIGSNVTTIGNAAFENCTSLTNVVLGDYVITVGSNAFNGCSNLTSVTIGSGVRNIGTKAFYGCPALTSVICKPAVPPVMASSDCFDCYSMATLTVHPAVIDDYRSDANWGQFATIVESMAVNPPLGDADGDGEISIRDVSTLIDMLLGM